MSGDPSGPVSDCQTVDCASAEVETSIKINTGGDHPVAQANGAVDDGPRSRCRIGHCVEMSHMAFVDWQAPTDDGVRSGLFGVNLTLPMALAVESHPTNPALRRLTVDCGDERVAVIDALSRSVIDLHSDMWDALSAARTNYASHARRQSMSAHRRRLAEPQEETRHERLSCDTGDRETLPAKRQWSGRLPIWHRMSTTAKGVFLGFLGYILITAAGVGAYSAYTAHTSGGGASERVSASQTPLRSDSSSDERLVQWQPNQK